MPRTPLQRLLLTGTPAIPLVLVIACGGADGSVHTAAPQPAVTRIHPTQGYAGDEITLEGRYLDDATAVTFGGVDADVFSVGPQGGLVAMVPVGAKTGSVRVRTSAGLLQSPEPFVALPDPAQPTITGWTPDFGGPGTLVTLEGTGFTLTRAVLFGGVRAYDFQVLSDTRMTVRIPEGAKTDAVLILLPAWVSGESATAFPITPPPPAVAGFSPPSAPPGASLTLSGAWNGKVTDVTFSSNVPAAFTPNEADGTLTVQVPENATTGPITVISDPGGAGTSREEFTILQEPPTVDPIVSPSGGSGDVIPITGARLGQVTSVLFNGLPAAFKVAADGRRIEATVPFGASSGPLVLLSREGKVPGGGDFTVTGAVTAVTGTDRTHALPGDVVQILGQNLSQVTQVRLGDTPVEVLTKEAGIIHAAVPPGIRQGEWSVSGPGGSLTVPGLFTVDPLPAVSVTSISPAAGVPGDEIVLKGTNLAGVAFVKFGEERAPRSERNLFDWEGSEFRFFVPRTANASAPIHIHSLDGTVTTLPAEAFRLTPSRNSQTYRPVSVLSPRDIPQITFPTNRRRSNIGSLYAPKSTIFDAADVDLDGLGIRPAQSGGAKWTLDLALAPCFYPALPAGLRAKIEQELKIPPANVEISVSTQNYHLDGTTPTFGVWLMRPHFWTEAGAPARGSYAATRDLLAGIFDSDEGVTFSPKDEEGSTPKGPGDLHPITITTQPDENGLILPTGNAQAMAGFDPARTTGFWTLVAQGTGPEAKAEASLHLFLDDAAQADLTRQVHSMTKLQDVLRWAQFSKGTPMEGTRARSLFLALWRPLVDPDRTTATRSQDGTEIQLTLRGTGLSGVRKARCQPSDALIDVEYWSDGLVECTAPAGTASVILISPDTADSDPVPVPQA